MHGGNIWAAARRSGRPPSGWYDFSASINPMGPPPWVMEAVRRSLETVHHYPDPEAAALTEAAAQRYQLDPAAILFGNGAAELIHLVVAALAPTAGLVLAPTFARYAAALRLSGAAVAELPAWPAPPDPAALQAWLAGAPPDSVIFLCHPNNPTGRLLPEPFLAAALAQDRAWVVVDEAFLDFVPGQRTLLGQLAAYPRLIVLRSLTKLYAIPGLRLGWVAAHPGLISRMRRLQVPWSVNGPALAAGLAALTGPDCTADTHAAVADGYRCSLQALAKFERWLRPHPTDCNYFLAALDGITGTALQERLLPYGLLVRTCTGFSGLGDSYLRLAVRPHREVDRLAAALSQVLLP